MFENGIFALFFVWRYELAKKSQKSSFSATKSEREGERRERTRVGKRERERERERARRERTEERMASLRYIESKEEMELYVAAGRGEVSRLTALLEAGVCPNVHNKVGREGERERRGQ